MNINQENQCRELCQRIANHRRNEMVIDYDLLNEGPKLIKMLTVDGEWSLRELAKMSGLSPAYLSQVTNGHTTISHGAYCRIAAAASIIEKF